MDKRDDFRPTWTPDKTFEDGIVLVTVNRSNHRDPRYRIEVSFKTPTGSVRSLAPRFNRVNGKVTTERYADIVRRLFGEAEGYVNDMMQASQDEYMERQTSRGNHDGTKKVMGIKALGKQDKEKALAKKAAEAKQAPVEAKTEE